MSLLFRVLYSNALRNCWRGNPPANSSHHHPPCQWIDRWQKHDKESVSLLEENYPLDCNESGKTVRFTARARQAFFKNPSKDYSRDLLSRETYEVGELDGVCAFTSPEACLDWAATDLQVRDVMHDSDYVVFEGTAVSEAPEAAGVVAHVLQKIGNHMTLQEFRKAYLPEAGNAALL